MNAANAMAQNLAPGMELALALAPDDRLVFVDGVLAAPLSRPLPPGVRLSPEAHGALIVLEPGTRLTAPLGIVSMSTGTASDALAHRHRIAAGAGAEARIVEAYLSPDEADARIKSALEVTLAEDAAIDYVLIERMGARSSLSARVDAALGARARLRSTVLALGAHQTQSEVSVRFNGVGGACHLDGLYLAAGDQKRTMATDVDHATSGCVSRQRYKGILDGHARASFRGAVKVRVDAQKTDATQANPNLLLSRDATIETRPELEILADDVKCTHGATVGRLSEEALFFLRARGIEDRVARAMLVEAFAADVLERIEDPTLRAIARRAFETRGRHAV